METGVLVLFFVQLIECSSTVTTESVTVSNTVTSGENDTVQDRWSEWTAIGECQLSDASCEGVQKRERHRYKGGEVTKKKESEYIPCNTSNVIDGGLSEWTDWDDCSMNCNGTSHRYRQCNSPLPCNGGLACTGSTQETMDCGPVDGSWTEWEDWSECAAPPNENSTGKVYGQGTTTRWRYCLNPPPICGGVCHGKENETKECKVIPACFTDTIFDANYMDSNSPMVVYSSAKVIIETQVQNLCQTDTFYDWHLYRNTGDVNNETVADTGLYSDQYHFILKPGVVPIGTYRMYVKIGYPDDFTHWLEESMFVKIENPPPNTFIMGGTGRIIGAGIAQFDGRSLSYSLKNPPGDPSGLVFDWACLQFVTPDIDDLLSLYVDPIFVFGDNRNISRPTEKLIDFVNNLVSAMNTYQLFSYIRQLPVHGLTADELNVTFRHNFSMNVYENYTTLNNNDTALNESLADWNITTFYEGNATLPLTEFFNIRYMADMKANVTSKLIKDVFLPDDTQRMTMEFLEINKVIFGDNDTFLTTLKDTRDSLSDSFESVNSILNLSSYPNMHVNFIYENDMISWLEKVNDITDDLTNLYNTVYSYQNKLPEVEAGLSIINYTGIGSFFRLLIDQSPPSSEQYLLLLFNALYDIIYRVKEYDWKWIEDQETLFIDWIVNDLIHQLKCRNFTGMEDGFAKLTVTDQDVAGGHGYLVYLRVDNEGSFGYFIQHTQTVPGNPPELELECRLNCMKKTATSGLMSLLAVCKTCSNADLLHAKFSWNFKRFNFKTRVSENYTGWQDMMLTDLNSQKFVMNAGLPENQGFIVEASIHLQTGDFTTCVWLIKTDYLPYGGTCSVTKSSRKFRDKYEFEVRAINWKDEGFRKRRDDRYDWKEQLNYRIDQLSSKGSSILYYGYEELSNVKIKPGLPEDNYEVTLEVQIHDIFKDYATCNVTIPNVFPPVSSARDTQGLTDYITNSSGKIDYYYQSGNYKLVAMGTEVVGGTVDDIEISEPSLNVAPSNYTKLGTLTLDNGTVQHFTFDELWNDFQSQTANEKSIQIIQKAMDGYATTLDDVSEAVDVESLTSIRQLYKSIGTVINNKQFVDRSSASAALDGTMKLVDKFTTLAENDTYPKYEDYMDTFTDILRVLSNALDGVSPELSADLPPDINIYTMRDHLALVGKFESDTPNIQGEVDDLTDTERALMATQMALKSELDNEGFEPGALEAAASILKTVSKLEGINNRKQLPLYVRNKGIATSMDVKPVTDLLHKGLEQDYIKLEFDSKCMSKNTDQEQKTQLTTFDRTPFSWDSAESKYITSKTMTVSIGNTIPSILPSKLIFKNDIPSKAEKTLQCAIGNEEGSCDVYYKTYWRNPTDPLMVTVHTVDRNISYIVTMKRNTEPTDDEYDWKQKVTHSDWKTPKSFSIIISGGLYDKLALIYIRMRLSRVTSQRISASTSNVRLIKLTILTGTTGCRVWNNAFQSWDKTSCRLSPNSTIQETICLCTKPPGNSFATTFYVPPNMIDFGSVLSKFDISNSAVLFTVIGVIVLFILCCVYAVKRDRGDPEKWAVSYMVDNSIDNEYLYLMTVFTGLSKTAGTKSKVRFLITGETMTTDVRQLDDGNNKGFGQGSIRKFVMSVPEKIENPSFMSVWHDNSGQGSDASWYLSKIVLDDIQTSEQYTFIFEEWLSLDKTAAMLKIVAPVVKENRVFSFLFNEHTRNHATESHLWLSVCLRPEPGNFSRVKRLSCCLALLFLSMITNAMFHEKDTGAQQILFGPIKLSLTSLYISIISILITIPSLFLMMYLFKNARPFNASKEHSDVTKIVVNQQLGSLSAQFQILAWFLVILSVTSSGFFLILYSMEWGKSKSEEWLLSFFLSFVESIFIVDPLKIVFISTLLVFIASRSSGKCKKVKYNRSYILGEVKKRASSSMNVLLGAFRLDESMPLNKKTIRKLKVRRQQMVKAEKVLVELLVYLVFLFTLYTVSFSNRDVKWYTSTLHIKQHLVNQHINGTKFDSIKTSNDFYAWLNKTLIPFVYPEESVKGRLSVYNRQFTSDQTNYRVGPIRLRQVRSLTGDCPVVLSLRYISCIDKYSMLLEEETSYCVGWKAMPCPKKQAIYNITSDAWTFKSSLDLWGLPTTGHHSTYGGGGYVADFGVNNAISRQAIDDLYKYIWIDRQTRAIFTEFTLYNANENLFLYVSFLCEFPEFGSVFLTPSIQPFRPYQHIGSSGVIVFVFEIVALIAVVIFSVKMIYDVCKQGRAYFASRWSVFDLLIVVILFVSFVMYVGRCVMISNSMNAFKGNKYKFVNFGHIATWDEMFNVVLSFLIFLTTVRLIRVLSYSSRITQLFSVLSHVSNDLFGCFALFFIVYMALVGFGYLVFGKNLKSYRNMFVASTTITNAIIGKNSINNLFLNNPVIGRVYYFLFILFVMWVLMTMLCATLNVGISEVRNSSNNVPPPYGLVDLAMKLVTKISDMLRLSNEEKSQIVVNNWLNKMLLQYSRQGYECDRLNVPFEIVR